jgi:hypothetical protein
MKIFMKKSKKFVGLKKIFFLNFLNKNFKTLLQKMEW